MNWEALGAVAESISAVAILITLIYLAVQIRHSRALLEHNQKLAAGQMYQTRANAGMENQRLVAADSSLAELVARMTEGASFDELEPGEKRRLLAYNQMRVLHYDNLLYQRELGLIDANISDWHTTHIELMYPNWEASGANIPPRVQELYSKLRNGKGGAA